MERRFHFSLIGVTAAIVMASLAAQGDGRLTLTPDEVPWPGAAAGGTGTSGAAGIQTVVVKGNPAMPGLYTLLLRIPPDTSIEAHAHPDDRVATVISGTWYFGYGDRLDDASLVALPPGSVYTEPPGANHFALTKEEPVVVQITGIGPSGAAYVDPSNDPARGSLRVGADVAPPRQTRMVPPVYPPGLAEPNIQGTVILEVTVGPDGRVAAIQVVRSIPLLDQAAIEAVRQWEYEPTLRSGVPVPVIMTVAVQFAPPR